MESYGRHDGLAFRWNTRDPAGRTQIRFDEDHAVPVLLATLRCKRQKCWVEIDTIDDSRGEGVKKLDGQGSCSTSEIHDSVDPVLRSPDHADNALEAFVAGDEIPFLHAVPAVNPSLPVPQPRTRRHIEEVVMELSHSRSTFGEGLAVSGMEGAP